VSPMGYSPACPTRKRGLVTRIRVGQAGEYPIGDTILLAPPLVVTEEQVDRMVDILHDSIAACL
jgi:adenosylmethionine-8-amino-7-oxononanoate aminotransferase